MWKVKQRIRNLIPMKARRKIIPRKLRELLNRVGYVPDTLQHAMIDEKKVLNSISGNCVLDCGCGIGRWGYLIKSVTPTKKVIGLEIDKTYLLFLRKKKYYNFLVQGDIAYLPFKPKSFDTVLAIEVIEHQTKTLGINFLRYIDKVVKHRIILTTPSGFYEVDQKGFKEHKSGWCTSELKEQGYEVEEYEWHGSKWLFAVKIPDP